MAKHPKSTRPEFALRHDWSIGSLTAEEDDRFLQSCFVDGGFVQRLAQPANTASIVLGRTGAGKTAILNEVYERNKAHARRIDPEEFSIRYISNSNVIRLFEQLGVQLDIAYQMLWKHVLCVELIKMRYDIRDKDQSRTIFDKFKRRFGMESSKQNALDYLNEWGKGDFWQTTEKRVRELTETLESKLTAELKAAIPNINLNLGAEGLESLATKSEIVYAGQRIVNNIQMQDLHEVINVLAEDVFDASSPSYYIIIDDLDRGWAEDRVRYKLVRALIETIKRFRKIQRVKIIISVRTDLLETVFAATRDSGFQEDKYEDYFVRLRWSRDELRELVNKRVAFMVREKYRPAAEVTARRLFDTKVDKEPMLRYIIDRTMKRPRDVIAFVNECIQFASGRDRITAENVKSAEAVYSTKRVTALEQEWLSVYPEMGRHIEFLRGLKFRFSVDEIPFAHIQERVLSYSACDASSKDPVTQSALQLMDNGVSSTRDALLFLGNLFASLYKVGIAGVSTQLGSDIHFSEEGYGAFEPLSLTLGHKICVHPLAFRHLGTPGFAR